MIFGQKVFLLPLSLRENWRRNSHDMQMCNLFNANRIKMYYIMLKMMENVYFLNIINS